MVGLEATTDSAQVLHLFLHSEITPGGLREPYGGAGDQIQVSHMQEKNPTCCTIS